jgi:hypothetical protein
MSGGRSSKSQVVNLLRQIEVAVANGKGSSNGEIFYSIKELRVLAER